MPYTEYRELGDEIIEKSINRYVKQRAVEIRNEAAGFDPRIITSIAETEARGFVMEKGQWSDLLK